MLNISAEEYRRLETTGFPESQVPSVFFLSKTDLAQLSTHRFDPDGLRAALESDSLESPVV